MVRDGQGVGLGNVTVTLKDAATFALAATAQTDGTGHYAFVDLSGSSYSVFAEASERPELVRGHYPSSLSFATAVSAADGRADIDIDLPVGGSLSGHVMRSSDGAPAEGVCVYGARHSLTTDAAGGFVDVGLDAGSYTLTLQDCRVNSTLVSAAGPRVDVALGSATTGYDVALHEGSFLQGRAVDETGAAVDSCVDPLVPEPKPGVRGNGGSTGLARIGPLLPGESYTLRFFDCSSQRALAPAALVVTAPAQPGDIATLPDTVLHPPGSLSGTVTDQFGQPNANVCVSAVSASPGGLTGLARGDAEGRYVIGGLGPGSWSTFFSPCSGNGFTSTYLGSVMLADRRNVNVNSGQDTSGTDQTVRLWTVPTAPDLVAVSRTPGGAEITVTPPSDDGGTPITRYVMSSTGGLSVPAVTFADTRTFRVQGLLPRSTPSVTIRAANVVGEGAALTVAVPPLKASVTLTPSRATVRARSGFPFGGRLTWSNGHGSPYVSMFRRVAGSGSAWRAVGDTYVRPDGSWNYRFEITAPTEIRVMDLDRTGTVASSLVRAIGALTVTASRRTATVATVPARPAAVVQLQRHTAAGWAVVRNARLDTAGRRVETLPAGVYRYVLLAANYWNPVTGSAVTLR